MMLAHLADVSVRSILLALFGSVVLWFLARRSTAALQHAIWTSVVCGMLALLGFGQVLPRLPLRLPHRATGRASAIQQTAPPAIPQPAAVEIPTPAKASKSVDWSVIAACAYGAVTFAFLGHFAVGMFFARRLLAGARAVPEHNGVYESERVAVPVAIGWLRPRILLPLEWREWDRDELDAVLTHEGAHVRRHDGFVAALAGVNRCLFWFHPLAWMLEGKLAELAEQACDEFCVAVLGDCERYARMLLEVARMANGSRLRRHALTMAAGSHIGKRIDALLEEGRTFSRGLTWSAWAAIALCGIPVLWGAGAVELLAQAPAPPAQPAAQASPAFEVATIKPNKSGSGATLVPGLRNGTLSARNASLKVLIRTAYGVVTARSLAPPGSTRTTSTSPVKLRRAFLTPS
ncbi:MAG TPA: M56 family metallopeptidase [Bryobacteraceae bacterium]